MNGPDLEGWGVVLTADGVTTYAHMGIGFFDEAVAAFNELTPDHAEDYAEDARHDLPGIDRTDSALSVALGLPSNWVGGTTVWGWVIAREIR
jgi:hypothetical protein